MFRPPDDLFKELERMHRSLIKILNMGEKVLDHVQKSMPNWFRGPKTEVYDEGYKVRVVVEAPGLSPKSGITWSVKAIDRHHLALRGVTGESEEEFIKLITVPSPVKRKPMAVTVSGGLVDLEFVKTNSGRIDDRWTSFTLD